MGQFRRGHHVRRQHQDAARAQLRKALFGIRESLGPDAFLTRGEGEVRLDSERTWCDAVALAQHVKQGRWTEALALYRGPFLPDESEQPSFIACREQIRGKLLRCLTRVARWWEDNGMPDAAIDCYLRCIDADGLCEAFYRNLMQCYQRRGERAEALATYERLRTMLASRLKSTPSQETQAVYTALLS